MHPGGAKIIGAFVAAAFLAGCSQTKAPAPQPSDQPPPYVIGLGEIMGQNQMRHAKLWFAGKDRNWPLAQYEIDEMREGFGDAVTYDNHHKEVPRPLSELVPEFVGGPLDDLDKAVKAKDETAFVASFDELTAGCNGCHHEANFGFNVITRPTAPPFTNQVFEPAAGG